VSTFHDHFSSFSGRYADFRPNYPAALFDYLAALVGRTSLVWDCAAGNGQATVDLARRFDRVIATDASAEQIAAATRGEKIEYRVALAEQSGLSDGSVGLITVAQAVHWFKLENFWKEAKRVLAENGVIAVWTYGINEVEGDAVNELVQDFYSNTVGPYWPPERRLVEEGYRTISFPFERIDPPELRMETQWTLPQLIGYFSSWSATNRFIKATGRNPLEPLFESLSRVWGDVNKTRLVTWPLAMLVGRKPLSSN
jgi:SAM-dependent methyltransferase